MTTISSENIPQGSFDEYHHGFCVLSMNHHQEVLGSSYLYLYRC